MIRLLYSLKEDCIRDWSGDDTIPRVAIKMQEEISELGQDVLSGDKKLVCKEMADVVNVMKRMCYIAGIPYNVVNKKVSGGMHLFIDKPGTRSIPFNTCSCLFTAIGIISEAALLDFLGPCKMKKYEVRNPVEARELKMQFLVNGMGFICWLFTQLCEWKSIDCKQVLAMADKRLYNPLKGGERKG